MRRSVAWQMGGLFLLLAALLAGVCGSAIVNLLRVQTSTHRLLEETREERQAEVLLSSVETLASLSNGPARADLEAHRLLLGRAQRALGNLRRPVSLDPSKVEHAITEERIYERLEAGLKRAASLLEDGSRGPSPDELPTLLAELRELATGLSEETAEEASQAIDDLESRARRLEHVMLGTGAISLAVLVGVFALVRRNVVRPLGVMREGAEAWGRGELDRRIDIRSQDEVGELAASFNQMAERICETQRDLEERVEERTRQLFRTIRLADLGVFAAGVAHEVNTPLASIANSAEGLERKLGTGSMTPEEGLDYVKTIVRESYRASEITSRLLSFARQDPAHPRAVDLRAPIEEARMLLRHLFERHGVTLDLKCPEELTPVMADPSEMMHVVVNLLKNALDVSPPGGTISVRCRGRDGDVVLEVADEGPGVPESDRDRIFDPFFTTKPPGRGTGLGLALAHRIVSRHRGRLEVAEAEGGGALLRVVLPRAHA